MVQPFGNIPKLSDPGVAPAISGLSSGIGNLLQLRRQEMQNDQATLNQLLGGAFDLRRQGLANKASLEKQNLLLPQKALERANELITVQSNFKSTGRRKQAEQLNPEIERLLEMAGMGGTNLGQGQLQQDSASGGGLGIGGALPSGDGLDVTTEPPVAFGVSSPGIGFENVQGLETTDLPYETERAKTAQEQTKAIVATEEGKRAQEKLLAERSNYIINPKTKMVAKQPVKPGSTEMEPMVAPPDFKERQAALFNPDGSLNEAGKQLNKEVASAQIGSRSIIAMTNDMIKYKTQLGLSPAEELQLMTLGPDALTNLTPKQKSIAGTYKNVAQRLRKFILKEASEANQGRPTDKDYTEILAGYPKIISSDETFSAAAVNIIAALQRNLVEKELLLRQTAAATKDAEKYQKITNRKFEFGEENMGALDPEQQQAYIDTIVPREQQVITLGDNSPPVVDLSSPVVNQDATPTNAPAQSPPGGLRADEIEDLMRRYQQLKGQ